MSDLYAQYRQTSIQTAPPEQLVVMLYDGAIRFLEQAKTAISEQRDPLPAIGRAQDIVVELLGSLDRSAGPVADNLMKLYEFWIQRLFQASIRKDAAMVEEVAAMIRDLREAWATIAQQKRNQRAVAAARSAVNARG